MQRWFLNACFNRDCFKLAWLSSKLCYLYFSFFLFVPLLCSHIINIFPWSSWIHRNTELISPIVTSFDVSHIFFSAAFFRGKGGQLVLQLPARHQPRQGRGLLDWPCAQRHPFSAPPTGSDQGITLINCGYLMSNCGQYVLFLYCYTVYHMSLANGLVVAVYLTLTIFSYL